MAQIINFMKLKADNSLAERYKALAKGNIKVFNCDNCGEEVDAYFDINGEMICDDCAHDILITMYDYHKLYD